MLRLLAVVMVTSLCLQITVDSSLAMAPFSGPVFTEEPEDILVIGSAKEFSLTCSASGSPAPTVEWFLWLPGDYQRKPLKDYWWLGQGLNGNTITVDIEGYNSSSILNGAIFQCEATNLHGSVLSRKGVILISDLDNYSFKSATDIMQTSESSVALIFCPRLYYTYNLPEVHYTWYKDNDMSNIVHQSLIPSVFTYNTGALFFSRVRQEDAGTYHCVVTATSLGSGMRLVGEVSSPVWVDMNGVKLSVSPGVRYNSTQPPRIISGIVKTFPEQPFRVDNVTLQCYAYDNHAMPLQYLWGRRVDENGEELPLPAKYTLADGNRTLILQNVSLEDAGTYWCRVVGEFGIDEKATQLRVRTKPFFSQKMSNHLVGDGERLELKCFPYNESLVMIEWYKDGVLIWGESSITLTRDFLFTDRDSGMYQCAASNNYGDAFDTAQVSFRDVYGTDEDTSTSSRIGASSSAMLVAMVMMMTYLTSFIE